MTRTPVRAGKEVLVGTRVHEKCGMLRVLPLEPGRNLEKGLPTGNALGNTDGRGKLPHAAPGPAAVMALSSTDLRVKLMSLVTISLRPVPYH
jgi:hypothetical protein